MFFSPQQERSKIPQFSPFPGFGAPILSIPDLHPQARPKPLSSSDITSPYRYHSKCMVPKCMVHLPTFIVNYYGKCRGRYTITWISWDIFENHVCDSHITFTKGCEKFVGCDLASLFPEISILSLWVGESWLFLVVDMEVKYQSCNVLYIYVYSSKSLPWLDCLQCLSDVVAAIRFTDWYRLQFHYFFLCWIFYLYPPPPPQKKKKPWEPSKR